MSSNAVLALSITELTNAIGLFHLPPIPTAIYDPFQADRPVYLTTRLDSKPTQKHAPHLMKTLSGMEALKSCYHLLQHYSCKQVKINGIYQLRIISSRSVGPTF